MGGGGGVSGGEGVPGGSALWVGGSGGGWLGAWMGGWLLEWRRGVAEEGEVGEVGEWPDSGRGEGLREEAEEEGVAAWLAEAQG